MQRCWLGLYFPFLEIEASAPDVCEEQPVALADVTGKRLEHLNALAEEADLRQGMLCAEACAMVPELLLLEADWEQVARQQRRLEKLAAQFAERLFWVDRGLLLADLTGTERLWGKGVQRRRWLQQQFADWPSRTIWALAPSPYACWLFARWRPLYCESKEAQRTELARLPVDVLAEFDSEWPARLHQVGGRTLADFLRFSRRQLAALLGPEAVDFRERLLGSGWLHGKQPVVFPEVFRWQQTWDDEVEQSEALLFRLQHPLDLLYQAARKKGCRVRQIRFELQGRNRTFQVELAFSQHTHSVRQWLHLFRLRLLSLEVSPVSSVVLECRWFESLLPSEADLFADGRRSSLNVFLDRARARLGEAAVFFLQPENQHRPEAETKRKHKAVCSVQHEPEHAPRPLWLLPEPEPTELSFWRVLGEHQQMFLDWWEESPCYRDYVYAVHADGRKAWLFRDRFTGRWFVHGYWS